MKVIQFSSVCRQFIVIRYISYTCLDLYLHDVQTAVLRITCFLLVSIRYTCKFNFFAQLPKLGSISVDVLLSRDKISWKILTKLNLISLVFQNCHSDYSDLFLHRSHDWKTVFLPCSTHTFFLFRAPKPLEANLHKEQVWSHEQAMRIGDADIVAGALN